MGCMYAIAVFIMVTTGTYLAKRSCDVHIADGRAGDDDWILQDATFDCSVLSPCQQTCSGPNKDKLRRVSKECGCITEWFFHSVWLQSVISLVVFGLMNASRTGFIDGLSRVLWKSLHPGTFTVYATCDQKGQFLSGSVQGESLAALNDHNNNNNETEEIPRRALRLDGDIKKQIDRNSLMFRMSGVGMIVGALMLNVVWIVIVMKSPDATMPQWLYST